MTARVHPAGALGDAVLQILDRALDTETHGRKFTPYTVVSDTTGGRVSFNRIEDCGDEEKREHEPAA
jgi:hypothetical protein